MGTVLTPGSSAVIHCGNPPRLHDDVQGSPRAGDLQGCPPIPPSLGSRRGSMALYCQGLAAHRPGARTRAPPDTDASGQEFDQSDDGALKGLYASLDSQHCRITLQIPRRRPPRSALSCRPHLSPRPSEPGPPSPASIRRTRGSI